MHRKRKTIRPVTVHVEDIDDEGHLLEEIAETHPHDPSVTPELSAGDLDARWDQAEASGEETVGGSVPTPDQDMVDEIGRAAGVTYQEGEPLRVGEKEEERDRHRWELDPASAEDYVLRERETAPAKGGLKRRDRRRHR
ncbi:MAG TPA: DUF6335 family protein [Thermoanaerobaculia bacterium]|nr:DUF6335 family protein [Thermoanaerobaculia bacterium]